jgi:hypothetical protein
MFNNDEVTTMKTKDNIAITLSLIILAHGNAWAHGDHIAMAQFSNHTNTTVYSNPAYSHGIFGYPNFSEQQKAIDLQLIYQDTAHGQSIHSYARTIEENQSTGTLNSVVEKTYSESNEPVLSGDNVEAILHEFNPTQEN